MQLDSLKAYTLRRVLRDLEAGFEFGMSRMYEVLIEGRSPGTHRIFRDIEEAEAWLTEGSAG